ncbi:conserved hypothetical protein [Culex quinquefasciatus]|uniref:Uncharacterized protein n=1 Tax=Culex quinquefasciatus TaxID=7176 RepID=B0W4P9_CULQU|nr:conserved hypothetical protein [Culex quinquefasciatus]|eukprot:XP_001843683.1 conserved hypothetical protein [Culex quinquefasciatus]
MDRLMDDFIPSVSSNFVINHVEFLAAASRMCFFYLIMLKPPSNVDEYILFTRSLILDRLWNRYGKFVFVMISEANSDWSLYHDVTKSLGIVRSVLLIVGIGGGSIKVFHYDYFRMKQCVLKSVDEIVEVLNQEVKNAYGHPFIALLNTVIGVTIYIIVSQLSNKWFSTQLPRSILEQIFFALLAPYNPPVAEGHKFNILICRSSSLPAPPRFSLARSQPKSTQFKSSPGVRVDSLSLVSRLSLDLIFPAPLADHGGDLFNSDGDATLLSFAGSPQRRLCNQLHQQQRVCKVKPVSRQTTTTTGYIVAPVNQLGVQRKTLAKFDSCALRMAKFSA